MKHDYLKKTFGVYTSMWNLHMHILPSYFGDFLVSLLVLHFIVFMYPVREFQVTNIRLAQT